MTAEDLKDYDELECLECGNLCKPYKISPNGTVHYRCRRENEHGDNTARHWGIDINGDYIGD